MACDMKKSTTKPAKPTKPKNKAKKVAVAGAGKDMSKRKVYG